MLVGGWYVGWTNSVFVKVSGVISAWTLKLKWAEFRATSSKTLWTLNTGRGKYEEEEVEVEKQRVNRKNKSGATWG